MTEPEWGNAMVWDPGAPVRARIKGLEEKSAHRNEEEESEEAARRLDAEEVGHRADRRKAEREAENARPGEPTPRG